MKENYTNKELKELLEGVDIPSADKAWEKMSNLLDASGEAGVSTTVGHSAIFKTLIWLNSIFLVLTTVVVGAMYKSSSKSAEDATAMLEKKPTITIHKPPFKSELLGKVSKVEKSESESKSAEQELRREQYGENENLRSSNDQDALLINTLPNAGKSTIQDIEKSEKDISKTLGEDNSPGVSNKNDERPPAFVSTDKKEDLDAPEKSQANHDQQTMNANAEEMKDSAGGTFFALGEKPAAPVIDGYRAPRYLVGKAGVGLNRYSPPQFLLKQMQFGLAYTFPLTRKREIQLELLYNPVSISDQKWTEIKEISYVPYTNDITARKLNYISIPVLAKHRFTPNMAFSFGVQQSFLIGTTGDVDAQIQRGTTALATTYENIKDYSDEARFNSWNTAVLLGLEYQLDRWVFSGRFQGSMTDITSNKFGSNSDDRYRSFIFSAGYIFPAGMFKD